MPSQCREELIDFYISLLRNYCKFKNFQVFCRKEYLVVGQKRENVSGTDMAMITNIRHFMDGNGEVLDLSQEAKELLNFLTAIIEAATIEYENPVTLSAVNCRKFIMGKPCSGEIEVWVYTEDNQIGWECLACGDEGVISHWEGTPWDSRDYTRH